MELTIGFVDTETTGLDFDKGHRIIEIAFLLFKYDTTTGHSKPIGKYVQRINPDRSIDAKAQAVHKISIDDLMGEPSFAEVADKIVAVLKKCDLLVAHNMIFDSTFIVGELIAADKQVPAIETFCTMDNGRFATFDGMIPSLRRLCECFDIEYDLEKAHGALYDISLTAKCFFRGLEGGYYQLPEILLNQQEAA